MELHSHTSQHKLRPLRAPGTVTYLKQLLEIHWDRSGVPQCHRALFFRAPASCERLKKEIREIQYRSSPVLAVLERIEERERVLRELTELVNSLEHGRENKALLALEAVERLKELRLRSVEVTETIRDWRNSLFNERAAFEYCGDNYLHKMGHDTLFVLNSQLSAVIRFPEEFNTFLDCSLDNTQGTRKIRMNVHMEPSLRHRVLAAQGMMCNKSVIRKRKRKTLTGKASELTEIIAPEPTAVHVAVTDAHEDLFTVIWDSIEREVFPGLVHACVHELISAHLVLFSSKVLDKYIYEVVNSVTLQVVSEAHQEVVNVEYIELRDSLMSFRLQLELAETIEMVAREITAEDLSEEIVCGISFEGIAEEAVREEVECNEKNLLSVYDDLIDQVLSDSWVEGMIEEELTSLRLDYLWKILPQNVKRQNYKIYQPRIHQRIADDLYYDIINEIVGSLWVTCIVEATIKENPIEQEEQLNLLMPIPDYEPQRARLRSLTYIFKRK